MKKHLFVLAVAAAQLVASPLYAASSRQATAGFDVQINYTRACFFVLSSSSNKATLTLDSTGIVSAPSSVVFDLYCPGFSPVVGIRTKGSASTPADNIQDFATELGSPRFQIDMTHNGGTYTVTPSVPSAYARDWRSSLCPDPAAESCQVTQSYEIVATF